MSSDILNPEDNGDYYSILEKFGDWRNTMSVISPDEVLSILLRAGDFETAKQWCQLKHLTKEQYMVLKFMSI